MGSLFRALSPTPQAAFKPLCFTLGSGMMRLIRTNASALKNIHSSHAVLVCSALCWVVKACSSTCVVRLWCSLLHRKQLVRGGGVARGWRESVLSEDVGGALGSCRVPAGSVAAVASPGGRAGCPVPALQGLPIGVEYGKQWAINAVVYTAGGSFTFLRSGNFQFLA